MSGNGKHEASGSGHLVLSRRRSGWNAAGRPGIARAWITLGLVLACPACRTRGAEAPDCGPSATFRLVHPDRQAAAVLKLFHGSRAPHPRRRSRRGSGRRARRISSASPLEAVISFFNPEMIPEWKVLHGAEYRLGFDHEKGRGAMEPGRTR